MRPHAAACLLLLAMGSSAVAHQVDEYLQATTLSLEKRRVRARIRMTPGAEIYRKVLALIDTSRDGKISEAEGRNYAHHVLRDLSFSLEGKRLTPKLVTYTFPALPLLKGGQGQIWIELEAAVPSGRTSRRLVFENRHQPRIAAYLANCVVPDDPDLQVKAQRRNPRQSRYQIDYRQASP